MHVRRQAQSFGEPAGRVVITPDDGDRDAFLGQLSHALDKKQPGVVIGPVAIVQIAGDHDQIDSFAPGDGDQVFEGATGGATHLVHWSALVTVETAQGTVEMQVGGMQETHGVAHRAAKSMRGSTR